MANNRALWITAGVGVAALLLVRRAQASAGVEVARFPVGTSWSFMSPGGSATTTVTVVDVRFNQTLNEPQVLIMNNDDGSAAWGTGDEVAFFLSSLVSQGWVIEETAPPAGVSKTLARVREGAAAASFNEVLGPLRGVRFAA